MFRETIRPALLAAGLTMLISAAAGEARPVKLSGKPGDRGVEAPNQPVVERTDLTFDAATDGMGGLAPTETQRLARWFAAIDLAYGDRIGIADDGLGGRSGAADEIGRIVANYGLLLSGDAPVTAGAAAPGSVRVVVSRSIARMPGCPDWSYPYQADFENATAPGYGCAVNGNLAAMMADPEDLVRGRRVGTADGAGSARAIKAYRSATPSGAGGTLK